MASDGCQGRESWFYSNAALGRCSSGWLYTPAHAGTTEKGPKQECVTLGRKSAPAMGAEGGAGFGPNDEPLKQWLFQRKLLVQFF